MNPASRHVVAAPGAGPLTAARPRRRRVLGRPVLRVGVRTQLAAAALTWLVGAAFLLARGMLLAEESGPPFHPAWWPLTVAALAVAVGMVKARLVLVPYAGRAVGRIRARGRASIFGFFAPSSWAFIAVMMGTGIALRHSPLAQVEWGRIALFGLYVAVGSALLAADAALLGALRDPTLLAGAADSERATAGA